MLRKLLSAPIVALRLIKINIDLLTFVYKHRLAQKFGSELDAELKQKNQCLI